MSGKVKIIIYVLLSFVAGGACFLAGTVFLSQRSQTSIAQTSKLMTSETSASSSQTQTSSRQDAILQGDLSAFEGIYSNDRLEKTIADSGFKLYGYTPDDYAQDRTSVFPRLSREGDSWSFWSGSVHASYKLDTTKTPQKVDNYYEVYFVGSNAIVSGKELTLTLIPENVKAPDGTTSSENRIIYGQSYFRPYHNGWQNNYQTSSSQDEDLDIEAITAGDFVTLAGTWENGQGQELVIDEDGTVGDGSTWIRTSVNAVASNPPYVTLTNGTTASPIALFPIGAKNPDGDQSDSSRPRLLITQQRSNASAASYYYRK